MRRPLSVLALVLLIAGLFAPSWAGADPSDPPPAAGQEQGKRTEVQQKRQKVVSQIDLLKASDVDLQLEVNRLGNVVKDEEAHLTSARLKLIDVEAKLGTLADEVEQAKRDADVAKHRAAERAVDAYMHPGLEAVGAVLQAKDYDQAHRRRTMIGEVARFDQEILQGNLDAQQALAARQERLAGVQREADALRQEAEDALTDAQAAQAKQLETKKALEARIADFQSEADALSAQEANLTAIIKQHEADAQAAQKAKELSELAAAPPTTAAPAPTTAGPKPPTGGNGPTNASPPATSGPTTTKPAPTGIHLAWPLSGPVTSPFGMRWGRLHAGIDIGVPIGTPIHAAAAGVVFFCGVMDGYGNVVLIDHGNGLVTLYGHQNNLACQTGQTVSAGQIIGYSGNTGHSTGPHLHFEVRRNGTPVDPMQYLS